MAWTTPILVEICISTEINGYIPSRWIRATGVLISAFEIVCSPERSHSADVRVSVALKWAGGACEGTAQAKKVFRHSQRRRCLPAAAPGNPLRICSSDWTTPRQRQKSLLKPTRFRARLLRLKPALNRISPPTAGPQRHNR